MASENKRTFCSACEENYDEECVFTCATCETEYENKESESENNNADVSFIFCDSCVFIHCKKGHDIKDIDGRDVLTCKDHKQILDKYCKTCDDLFCVKCLRNHFNHQIGSVEERVKEIKKNVFEQLTKFETMEKPAKAKESSISTTVERNENDVKKVLENIEKVVIALKGKVETALSKFKETEKRAKEAVSTIIEIQGELRGLLSLTSQQLVIDWRDVKTKIRQFKSEEMFVQDFNLNEKQFLIGRNSRQALDNVVEDMSDTLELSIPNLKSDASEKKCFDKVRMPFGVSASDKVRSIFSSATNFSLFVLVQTEQSLQLYKYDLDAQLKEVKRKNFGSIDWQKDLSIKSMFQPFSDRTNHSGWTCLLLLTDGSIVNADFGKGSWSKYESASVAAENLISPLARDSQGNINWYYWNAGFVQSTSAVVPIPCPQKSWCRYTDQKFQIILNPQTMNLSVFMSNGSSLGEISRTVHGCDSIDHISIPVYYDICLVLWSISSKTVTVVRHKEIRQQIPRTRTPVIREWEVEKKVNWTNETRTFNIGSPLSAFGQIPRSPLFLPAIELNPNPHSTTVRKNSHIIWAFLCHGL